MQAEGRIAGLDDAAWHALLLRSVETREVEGIRFPGFPDAGLQRRFVGSDGATALREAFGYVLHVKAVAARCGVAIAPGCRLLDFGCGWGRFQRIWWKDVGAECLFGCDIHEPAIALCRELGVPGHLDRLYHWGRLPYADASMDVVSAYSVFTHLSEAAHRHWLAEIARVLRPGGILALTLEPPRFLDYVAAIPPDDPGHWQAQLRRFAGEVPALRARVAAGGFAFLPTGSGADFAPEAYGDAVVPRAFVEREWAVWFTVRDWVDDPARFFQAVVVAVRL
jgi:SAM-dependent methyltransferase